MPSAMTLGKLSRSLERAFQDQELRNQLTERFRDPDQFWQSLGDAELVGEDALDEVEVAYLQTLPSTISEVVRAAAADAFARGARVDLLYVPAYDYSVQVWDYGQGISMKLETPYPPNSARSDFLDLMSEI